MKAEQELARAIRWWLEGYMHDLRKHRLPGHVMLVEALRCDLFTCLDAPTAVRGDRRPGQDALGSDPSDEPPQVL